MINICCPTIKRYDLLRELVKSCRASNVRPDNYYIIDNGKNSLALLKALGDFDIAIKVHTPIAPMGIAEAWNWFIKHVPEERVLVNDDITFAPHSLEVLVASPASIIWAKGCGFSCFVLRDECVKNLGLFDETISPGYGYYEDEDYLQRLDGRGTRERSTTADEVECGVVHHKSATLQASSHEEILDHHRKFKIAQGNYVKKWKLEAVFR